MQKLIHWKHNWSPKTWRGLNTRQGPDVLCMLGGIFFFIPMAFIQIEQLTKLFLYFSINIQLQSCYTYIPTIQQVVHSCYGCQKSSMHNCYTSVIMAMMIILKPPELIHTVTAPKTCLIQCSIFLSFNYNCIDGKRKKKLHVNKWLEITTICVSLLSSGKMVINISGSCLLFKTWQIQFFSSFDIKS